ncbi:MAG: DUF1667 domain-containing protein [Clostridia bacterium]|nr:DUF1667 domain-containing protein [Clostridia bacterium]
MIRPFTCIVCPNGCEITAEYEPGREEISVKGAGCPRGNEYVRQELIEPRRTIASSVRLLHGELPLVSVRLDKPVRREMIPAVMEEIQKQQLEAPVQIGDVVIANVLDSGSNVIITKNVARAD